MATQNPPPAESFRIPPEGLLLRDEGHDLALPDPGDFVSIRLPSSIGQGRITLGVASEGIYVGAADVVLKEALVLNVPGHHLIRFRVWLSHRHALVGPRGNNSQVLGPHSSVAVVPETNTQRLRLEMGKRLRFLGVLCEPQRLSELIGHEDWGMAHQYADPGDRQIQACFMPVDASVGAAASDLVDPPYSGRAGSVLTRSRALELVTRMLRTPKEQMRQFPSRTPLSVAEIDRLNDARAILARSISAPITINRLAKMSGLGRSKLTQGFKALFGETIATYVERQRMDLARDLLRSRAMTIAQVAEHVGYQHQSTFSTAFRKYFGICPKTVRI